jgi:2-polyprenyl-3-methyl-5-hydroxy-6-metoxy-1,4-benzoquinol methylase
MQTALEYVVQKIGAEDPLHGKKIKKNLKTFDESFNNRANLFLNSYQNMLKEDGYDLDFAIKCYLKMIADVNFESVQFLNTGKYTSVSFEEVNERVYSNPEVMEYYMHGLLLSQFLWKQHNDILIFFNKIIKKNCHAIKNYLEVGGGHGLYISEAISLTRQKATYDLVDISKVSLGIAKRLINNEKVNYIHSDIFEYHKEKKYDFITMGEVLEHVEDPIGLLKQLYRLLKDDGKVFITTPTNAPAIDHIYLFKNVDDIRQVIKSANFNIEKELCISSEDISNEMAEQLKVSIMYGALLTKNKKN